MLSHLVSSRDMVNSRSLQTVSLYRLVASILIGPPRCIMAKFEPGSRI